jgi:hypothetical protein
MGEASTFWSAFLDGFTMSGFFQKLSIPGAPTRIFKEPGSVETAKKRP